MYARRDWLHIFTSTHYSQWYVVLMSFMCCDLCVVVYCSSVPVAYSAERSAALVSEAARSPMGPRFAGEADGFESSLLVRWRAQKAPPWAADGSDELATACEAVD